MPIDLSRKTKIPDNLPAGLEIEIRRISASSDKEAYLQKAYDYLSARYRGGRMKTYALIHKAFQKDLEYLWEEPGFMHCTNMNFLLRTMLIKSGLFNEEDIHLKWTFVWFVSPHQYVQVDVGDRWIDVDIWAKRYGIEFGDHAHGFH